MKQPVHESAEDYLKAVLALEREHGYVRAVDVAGRLGVSKASVSKALSKLERQKLVHVVAHDVRLTAEGRAVAERVSERHAFFRALLRAVGTGGTTPLFSFFIQGTSLIVCASQPDGPSQNGRSQRRQADGQRPSRSGRARRGSGWDGCVAWFSGWEEQS